MSDIGTKSYTYDCLQSYKCNLEDRTYMRKKPIGDFLMYVAWRERSGAMRISRRRIHA